jgi:hypothetical protein
MPGRVDDAEAELAKREFLAVIERPEWVDNLCRLVEAELGFEAPGEPAGAGNMIGMGVGIDDVTKMEIPFGKNGFILVGDKGGIDDGGFTCLAARNEIRGATATLIEKLLEIQQRSPLARCSRIGDWMECCHK